MCNQDCSQTARVGAASQAPGAGRRSGVIAVIAWLLALACLAPGALHAEATAVRDIRIATHGNVTRVVIDLNRRVSFRHLSLDGPPRLAIDLPEVGWEVPRLNGRRTVGLVKGLRFGRFRPGVARIVLDVAEPFEISKVFELPPGDGQGHRIVTDLVELRAPPPVAVNGTVRSAAAERHAALVVAPPPPKEAQTPPRRRVLVIDPGHGGIDPGAIGSAGTYEKDVVLAVALELRRQLEATGRYEVVMTRESDSIMRLRDRLQTARESDGELFLSLHADSLVQAPEVRGASVYTLSEQASNEEAARLAGKENRADILAGIDLSDQEDIVTEILIDLAQRDANNKSIRLAELLVGELRQVSKMARQRRSQAGFVVLKSPDMPSALIELGYLSNAEDERALRDREHLAMLAKAMVQAVDQYFDPGRS
jgi:N-acetylmuramoyl-L-alanine amidase